MFDRSAPQQLEFAWSAEASHASPIPSPESDLEPPTSAISGPTTRASSARRRRPSSSSKTCQGCSLPRCVECWPTLPSSGSMRSGQLSALGRSAPRIDDRVSGSLLPTPTASTYGYNQGGSAGRSEQPKRPSLDTIEKSWIPTPCARDTKGPSSRALKREGGMDLPSMELSWLPTPTVSGEWNTRSASPRSGDGLATVAGSSIRLREWMMAAPEGWTSVNGKRLSGNGVVVACAELVGRAVKEACSWT